MGKQTSVSAPMTKDLLMKYTFVALCILAAVSFISYGFDSIIISAISVLVAVTCDYLLSLIMGDKGPLDTMSAAVFGLIVAMSYSLGLAPAMATEEFSILGGGYEQYVYPAIISAIGEIVFKKLQGLAGRKYVNPAAITKLLVLGLLFMPAISALIPADHTGSIDLQNRRIEGPFGTYYPMDASIFGTTLIACYGSPSLDPMDPYTFGTAENPLPDVLYNMIVLKYHGWIGGVSSIAVIVVGIALILICRVYIKWRITLAYLVTTALFSIGMGYIYGGDIIIRLVFHLFTGSSIFMAFFMATDPATTPLTRLGQIIFGIGLAILTMLIQVYMGFLGGSILALVIMNLTCPLLDRIGVPKPSETKITRERTKAKEFETAKVTNCIRCGKCLESCRKNLSPILIKEAVDKGNWEKAKSLNVEYCIACPPNCQLCVDICPTNALVMSGEREITVSPELCIHCKACQNICPRGEIHVTIDRISHLPITSATWVTVLERFASYQAATKELAAKSMKKLRETVESRA